MQIRVTKPGHADRVVSRSELADAIAAGWTPSWDQSVETLARQVEVQREGIVDLAELTAGQIASLDSLARAVVLLEQVVRILAGLPGVGSPDAPTQAAGKP